MAGAIEPTCGAAPGHRLDCGGWPKTQAQLTLSGHTHGGQVSIFGWRFTQINNREDCGLYRQQQRALYVSSGLGGFLPFRLGVVPEIVVITLHRSAGSL